MRAAFGGTILTHPFFRADLEGHFSTPPVLTEGIPTAWMAGGEVYRPYADGAKPAEPGIANPAADKNLSW
jgi:hypothetical protein